MTPIVPLSLTLVLLSFYTKPATLTQAKCLPDQHHALLQLKQGFRTYQLQWWNTSTDCCRWDGVACDHLTGLVIGLDLTNRSISGELNPALFNLNSLQYLNLSYNQFDSIQLPQTGFEKLANLTHLNLSYTGFVGQVPFGISVLTNLISLDLSNYNSLELKDLNLHTLLSNLTKIQFLYLDGVNISFNGSGWGKAVSQVGHTLEELSMMFCSLTGPIDSLLAALKQLKVLQLDGNDLDSQIPKFIANFSSLSILSLSQCGLRGHFPDDIFHHTNLTKLDLRHNPMLSGQLPEFRNGSFFKYLSLIGTNFTGPIPNSIGNLQKLSILYLSYSNFYGEIPASMGNITRLIVLDLSGNRLSGMIPMSLFSLPSLESLYLSENHFTGNLAAFSNWSSTLRNVYLGKNNLQGKLPILMFKLPLLSALSLESNNFTGTFDLDIIKHSRNLTDLFLSNNKLSIIQERNHSKSFYSSFPQLKSLFLASCGLTMFPSFLNCQRDMEYLDLSNNKIDGSIPNWLWSNKALWYLNFSHNFFTKMEWDASFISLEDLAFLDIHSNMITGSVPLVPPTIGVLDFSSNNFSIWISHFSFSGHYLSLSNNSLRGEIPLSICNASSLRVLDLSYNNLIENVPPCLLEGRNALEVINLKSNKLTSIFPRDISQGCRLETINLSENKIKKSLPQSLTNCKNLEVLDFGNNQIRNIFPFFLGYLRNLSVLILRSNYFYGTISNIEMNHKVNDSFFPMLKVLDLSSNCFNGSLPEKFFGFLKAMMTNSDTNDPTISHQYGMYSIYEDTHYFNYNDSITVTFKGQDIDQENSLGIFSSLDLSNNRFWGEMPKEIGQLKLLNLLNLSHNALTGFVPSEFANLKQLESLDLSFNQLSEHIPQELTSLTFLEILNLSYNNLVGEIPQLNQFLTFKNDSYKGNLGLCGSPLTVQCRSPPSNHGLYEFASEYSSVNSPIWLSISIGVGFAVGFASVIWAQVSWEKWKKVLLSSSL